MIQQRDEKVFLIFASHDNHQDELRVAFTASKNPVTSGMLRGNKELIAMTSPEFFSALLRSLLNRNKCTVKI